MKFKLINKPTSDFSPVQQILYNRGIPPKEIEHYLKTTKDDILDPISLGEEQIKRGVAAIVKSIQNSKKILVIVDCDADGYTSAAALINYLIKIFPSSASLIDIRLHEGKEHGIEKEWLADIAENYSLVICPDSSSNDYFQHKFLKDNGVTVLVLDHHEADKISEDAIIINNQLSNYKNKSLSGVGIVYKFCSYFDSMLGNNEADKMLDLVALGNIGDMMDLRDFETKHLIGLGLSNIINPFFKGLVDRQSYSLGGSVTPIGVAFYIAPLLNATIRVGTSKEKEIMFRAMIDTLAYESVASTKRGHKGEQETVLDQAIRNGSNIRNRQKKVRDSGMELVEEVIKSNNLNKNKVLVVDTTDIVDKNLTGLVANQIMAKYQKPTLLLRKVFNEEDGVEYMQGSGRGYDKSELNDFREFLIDSSMFEYASGHSSAFGAGIASSKIDKFIEYSNTKLDGYDFTACYDVDYVYDANNMNSQDIIDIGSMKALWGKGVDESFVAIKSIKVTSKNITLMSADRNPTIKITLPNGISIIKFGATKEEFDSLKSEKGYNEINVVGTCSLNEWQGRITPQILVKEYEVVKKQEYYF